MLTISRIPASNDPTPPQVDGGAGHARIIRPLTCSSNVRITTRLRAVANGDGNPRTPLRAWFELGWRLVRDPV